MEIIEQRQGAVTVLKPVGPLCEDDAEQFRRRAAEQMARSLGRIIVDVSAVPYVDSKGLEGLLELTDMLGQSGQALKLCAANDTLREVLDLTELASMFEPYEDVSAAVRSFL